jgi:hypothetical protein
MYRRITDRGSLPVSFDAGPAERLPAESCAPARNSWASVWPLLSHHFHAIGQNQSEGRSQLKIVSRPKP